MRIAFNPSTVAALTSPPDNKDITFDLRGHNIFARGVKFYGTDTNTWRDIKINNVSIGSHTLDLRNGSNTTLTNTNGVVTINSTQRPVVDNLTSNSTTSSLSANQGRVLAGLINGKSDSDHNHDDRYLKLTGGTLTGNLIGTSAMFSGRFYGGGDDEGIIIKPSPNGYAGLILGTHDGERSIFYFVKNKPFWRYSHGSDNLDIIHPKKSGTIALTSDIPSSVKNPYSLTTFGVVYDGSTEKVVSPSNFISQLEEGTSVVTDGTMLITSYASNSGFADTNAVNVPYKRKAVHLWEYIKAKTDSLYATKNHNHDGRYVYNYGGTATNGQALNQNALFMSTTSGITGDWWHILQAAWNGEYRWNSQIAFPTQNRNGMYYRSGLDDNTKWGSWVKLLDVNNYSSTLDSRYYTESEVNSLLSTKLDRVKLTTGSWNPRSYNLAADYHYNGGDLSISESKGQIHVSIDGYFWQNEGQYRVLDTSDVAGLKGDLTVHQYLSATDATWWPLIWGGSSHANTSDSTGAVYKSHDKLSWQTSSQTLYATHLRTTYIDLENNRGIFQVTSKGTSPFKGIKLPNLQSNAIGLFSRVNNSSNEGGIILSEDTCVIYNSFDTGWGLSVRDKDRGQTDISGDGTIAFGIRQDYRAYSLGGFEKSGSDNSYVLLGGGGHKLESALNVANADTLDGWHKDNIQWTGYITSPNSVASYWFKMYDITVTGYQYNDITITFLVSEGYSSHFSIFYLRIRQNGAIDSGNYSLSISLYELVGNLRDKVVAYYNNSTGNVQLWGNTGSKCGTMNYTILKKTTRTDTDSSSLGTLTAQSFSSVQTPPSTGYSKVTMSRVGSVSYSDSTGSVHWNNITNKPSTFAPSAHTHKWADITDHITKVSQLTNDMGYLTSHQSLANYYTKTEVNNTFVRAGNFESSDLNKLDTYSFIKSVNSNNKDTSPKGNTGWYNVIQAVHRNGAGDGPGYIGQIALGMTTNTDDMFFRGKRTDPWKTVIHSGNIANQSVKYATNAGNSDKVDGYHATSGRTFNGNINWSDNWNDAWSDGTHKHPWYGFDHRYPNTGTYSTTISDFFGMTIKTANSLRLDCANLLINGIIYINNVNAQIRREGSSQMWVNGRNGALLRETSVAGYHALWSLKTTNGSWDFGEYNAGSAWNNIPVLSYITDSNYNSGNNEPTYQIKFPLASGTVALTSNILNPTNYYWANVKVSASSSTTTSPTVHTLTATRVCAGHNPEIDNSISCSNWFRSSGNTGWYNTTYQGGWYMSDTYWIRAHNSVGIYTGGQIYSGSSIRMGSILLERTNEINSGDALFINYRSSTNVSLCDGGGNVGIGTISPTQKLDVNGNITTKGFGIQPCYLSELNLLPIISPGDGYNYRCLEIGKTTDISCIIADKAGLMSERGILIKFNKGYDGQIILLKDLQNYGIGNGSFWVMPSECRIIKADDSSTLIDKNQISNTYDDGRSRFLVYSSTYNIWIEFLCANIN